MASFVKFPGTAGSYASTDDVNIGDADTMHGEQGVGKWLGAVTSEIVSFADFGTHAIEFPLTTGSGELSVSITATGTSGIAVLPDTTYSVLVSQRYAPLGGGTAPKYELKIRQYDDAGGLILNQTFSPSTQYPSDTWIELTGTLTTAPNAAFLTLNAVLDNTRVDGDLNYTGRCCVRQGTDASFVPSLRIVGDLDMRARLALPDWTPAATPAVLSKNVNGDRSYMLFVDPAGTLKYQFSQAGSTMATKESTVPTGFADDFVSYIRVTHDVDDDAGGYDVEFFTSSDGAVWVQLGATVNTGGATSIWPGGAAVEAGSRQSGGELPFLGDFYTGEVRDGIDGPIVAIFDADDIIL